MTEPRWPRQTDAKIRALTMNLHLLEEARFQETNKIARECEHNTRPFEELLAGGFLERLNAKADIGCNGYNIPGGKACYLCSLCGLHVHR